LKEPLSAPIDAYSSQIRKVTIDANKSSFTLNPDESILYRSGPASKRWGFLVWKILGGLLAVGIFTLILIAASGGLVKDVLSSFLPDQIAVFLSQLFCLAIAPILIFAGFVEDVAQSMLCEVVLTEKRLWIKGSPYAWNPGRDIPLDDIHSLKYRRDAIFIRQISNQKLQVHNLPDSQLIAREYAGLIKKG
jgi:hypothetical protein